MLKIGSVINNKFRVLHKLGTGGMSSVYLVLNEDANKEWAVKEIQKSGKDENNDLYRQKLVAETAILKNLHHKNLPSIVDVFELDESYLIMMDFIEGVTLKKKVDEGPQPQEDVVNWALQVCDVLSYLHHQDPPIIYRDTKPANLMLKPDGTIVLIDFGTAREYKERGSEDTQWLGTKGYAAPEQYGDHGQTDARTDVYNLGATIYHLLTGMNPGKPPYEIRPIREWSKALSTGLEKIVQKCTRNDPEERYQTIDALRWDLEHYRELEDEYQQEKRRRRIATGLIFMIGILSLLGSFWAKQEADSVLSNNYESYVRAAQGSATEAEMKENYAKAISLSPGRGTAYEEFLEKACLADSVFDKEEADELSQILATNNAESALSENAPAYANFAYQLGLAYFYYYEGEGNKQMSEPWFAKAMESGALEANKAQRAERLYRIAGYYQTLNRKNKAGDAEISYREFWEDLEEMASGDIVKEDNARTAYVIYKEVAYQLVSRASEFKKSGVEKAGILRFLDNMDERLTEEMKEGLEEQEANELHELISRAKQSVENAYRER